MDLKSFPYNAWRKLSKDILTDDKTELFRSGESKGELGFRQAICNYLHPVSYTHLDVYKRQILKTHTTWVRLSVLQIWQVRMESLFLNEER